jgi:hypothetical protein
MLRDEILSSGIPIKVYNMFHRQYMHRMLMDSAVGPQGEGIPAKLVVNHKVVEALEFLNRTSCSSLRHRPKMLTSKMARLPSATVRRRDMML